MFSFDLGAGVAEAVVMRADGSLASFTLRARPANGAALSFTSPSGASLTLHDCGSNGCALTELENGDMRLKASTVPHRRAADFSAMAGRTFRIRPSTGEIEAVVDEYNDLIGDSNNLIRLTLAGTAETAAVKLPSAP